MIYTQVQSFKFEVKDCLRLDNEGVKTLNDEARSLIQGFKVYSWLFTGSAFASQEKF